MLGPFATASRRTPAIHQVSLLSHAACASMSTTTTTTTTRDRGDHYGPIEWAQYSAIGISFSQLHHCCILAMRHPITEQQLLVSREQHMDNVWSDCQSQLDDLGFLAMRAIANVV